MTVRTYVVGSTTLPVDGVHQIDFSQGNNVVLTNARPAGLTIGTAVNILSGTVTPPTDAGFTAAQLTVPMLYVDTTTPKLWVRTAVATWVGVALT